MRKSIFYSFLISVSLVIFSGCSSKKYYEPEDTVNHSVTIKDSTAVISSISPDGATLENLKFISKDGISETSLEDGFEFLNNVDGTIIASNKDGKLYVKQKEKVNYYTFKKRVISASIFKSYISLVFIDNSIALYDIDKQSITFKEYYKTSFLNDVKIANPIFLSTVVLCPTLDGKIIVVNFKTNQVVKTINIDPESKVNNIIYFKTINDTLISATNKKLFVFENGKVKTKDINIKDVVVTKENIYVATLEGNLIKYDHSLRELLNKKYRFAKFYTIGFTKYLYALESQGYIVRLDNNFENEKVFDFSFDEDNEAIFIDDTLYFDDKYILLK